MTGLYWRGVHAPAARQGLGGLRDVVNFRRAADPPRGEQSPPLAGSTGRAHPKRPATYCRPPTFRCGLIHCGGAHRQRVLPSRGTCGRAIPAMGTFGRIFLAVISLRAELAGDRAQDLSDRDKPVSCDEYLGIERAWKGAEQAVASLSRMASAADVRAGEAAGAVGSGPVHQGQPIDAEARGESSATSATGR